MSQKKKKFRPETTVYHSSSKILPALLDDIVKCYRKGLLVCKYCYYRKALTRTVIKTKDGVFCNTCSTLCTPMWIIPSSHFCDNYCINSDEIPIPPVPQWSYEKKDKPFSVCQRKSHYSCFEMSASADVWFAHSIEELVIWTIEREYRCSFQDYIDNHYHGSTSSSSSSHGSSKQQQSPTSSNHSKNLVGKSLITKGQAVNTPVQDAEGVLDPSSVMFEGVKDIPKNLLQSIISSYKKAERSCRYCFYYKTQIMTDQEEKDGIVKCKTCKRRWSAIKMIPSSDMCKNFGNFKRVPISIPATDGSENPHEYCNKSNHYYCFERFAENGFKYAHSLEELVIWTVERETVGYGNFMKYIMNPDSFNATTLTTSKPSNATVEDSPPKVIKYKPGGNMFSTISSIPRELLSSVCECYERRLMTCKVCFYDSVKDRVFNANPVLSSKVEGSNVCRKGHYWKPIRVIPASSLCESYGTYIGIPPYPHHMNKSKAPFQICNFKDHNICYNKTREKDPWFAHTVEEVVIWTVERERNADFSAVYDEYIIRKLSDSKDSSSSPAVVTQTPSSEESKPVITGISSEGESARDVTEELTSTSTASDYKLAQNQIESETREDENQSGPGTGDTDAVIDESENQPLLFVDDDDSDGEMDQQVQPIPSSNMIAPVTEMGTNLNGKGMGLTLQEASLYFPALQVPNAPVGGASLTTDNIGRPSTGLPDINPFLTQLPSGSGNSGYSMHHGATMQPTLSIVQPLPTFPQMGGALPQSLTLPISEEAVVYECFLCYREFESAKRLANHTAKDAHIELMKKDFYCNKLWQFRPYPPDQGPDDFAMCLRPGNCQGRVKCGSAHSVEERAEWMERYRHRTEPSVRHPTSNTPLDIVNNCGKDTTIPLYTDASFRSQPLKISVKPGVQGTSPKWKIKIEGQGWLTLLGVECCYLASQQLMDNQVVCVDISAIRGDTIYTINPRGSKWIASSFDDAILLGSVVLVVKGRGFPPGSHDCHVILYLGLNNCCVIGLKAVV